MDAFVHRRQISGKHYDFTSRMTMHSSGRDNLQDSATAFAANNLFRKLCEKLCSSLIIIEVNIAIIKCEITF